LSLRLEERNCPHPHVALLRVNGSTRLARFCRQDDRAINCKPLQAAIFVVSDDPASYYANDSEPMNISITSVELPLPASLWLIEVYRTP